MQNLLLEKDDEVSYDHFYKKKKNSKSKIHTNILINKI